MKVIKVLLIAIIAIIAIPLVLAIFITKDYSVTREIVINKPKQQVFDYVKLLKNQAYYHKWVMMDPNAKMECKGTDGTVGYISTWDSQIKDVGKGEQEIKSILDGQSIDCNVHFIKPFERNAHTTMITEAAGDNQTKIKWTFSGVSNYPMNIMNLVMDKMLGGDLHTSLVKLKEVLEKQ